MIVKESFSGLDPGPGIDRLDNLLHQSFSVTVYHELLTIQKGVDGL